MSPPPRRALLSRDFTWEERGEATPLRVCIGQPEPDGDDYRVAWWIEHPALGRAGGVMGIDATLTSLDPEAPFGFEVREPKEMQSPLPPAISDEIKAVFAASPVTAKEIAEGSPSSSSATRAAWTRPSERTSPRGWPTTPSGRL